MNFNTVLFDNILERAEDGRGDGTIYAWGTAATPDVSAKTFDLTTINIMTDLGADADDKFNGCILKFDSSENEYLILDWTAATDLALVEDIPDTEDTGAWTIRRALWTNDFAQVNPIHRAVNGKLYEKWIDKAANNAVQIHAAAPNGVDDGGFEKGSLTDFWTLEIGGTGTVAINAVSPILGTYDCKLSKGDQQYVGLYQAGKIDLKKGYTYGIILKVGGDGGAVTAFEISLRYPTTNTHLDSTWTKINAGDSAVNGGPWSPAITDATAWEEIVLTVGDDSSAGDYRFLMRTTDATDVFIDEIYIWEIGPTPASGVGQPDTIIIGNHNHAGGYQANTDLHGYRCPDGLSSIAAGDRSLLIGLDDTAVDGNAPIYLTWTATTSIFPIHRLSIPAIVGKTWEAGEIWVGKRWDWAQYSDIALTPYPLKVYSKKGPSNRLASINAKRRIALELRGGVSKVTRVEADMWKRFILSTGWGKPWWLIIPADTPLGVVETVQFMQNKTPPAIDLDRRYPGFYNAKFNFEETGEGQ